MQFECYLGVHILRINSVSFPLENSDRKGKVPSCLKTSIIEFIAVYHPERISIVQDDSAAIASLFVAQRVG